MLTHKTTIKDGAIFPSDHKRFLADLRQYEGKEVSIEIRKWTKIRSPRQNNSLWLFFSLLAEELNAHGYDMRTLIRQEVDILWTKDTICNYLWKPIQKAYCEKKSTTKLTTEEINAIYDIVNKLIAERTDGNIHIPFPCIDTIFRDDLDN